MTGSGDSTAHIWKSGAYSDTGSHTGPRIQSSEESADSSDDGGDNFGGGGDIVMRGMQISTPLVVLSGHMGVVVSADWLAGGEQIVTASWDRTANLWDVGSQVSFFSSIASKPNNIQWIRTGSQPY